MRAWSPLLMLSLLGCPKAGPSSRADAPVTIAKPPLDDRDYRYFELDNGMKAIVIHDADTDMAAAAMDVHVGQFSDPPDREGLAHFLEHMLFMGTEKYPEVGGYRAFVKSHGGRSNAGTSQEHTRYHFEVEQAHLEEALDRFAQFFVAPVLDPQYVQQERKAVDSEYRLKIQDEGRRFREVRRQTSNPAHGFAKFSVGNLDTLADRESDPVWDDLKAFYDAEYSASRMAVSVIGREDLDTLEGWVRQRLSAVPTTGADAPRQSVAPFLDDQLGVRVDITPLTELREVYLEWPVPEPTPYFREHPLDVLTYLVGQEGEGSIHALLNARGWITSLRSGSSGAEDHGLFTLRIGLTEEGLAHVDDVVDTVFQYVRRIGQADDLSPWWEQERRLAALNFQFAESPEAVAAVRRTSSALRTHPPEHALDWWATFSRYDEALQRRYLERLTPDAVRVFVTGPGLPTDRVEARYDVPYAVRPLEPARIERWSTGPIDPALRLPPMNPYIADDTALHPVDGDVGVPEQLVDEPGLEVWHLLDPSFGVPRSTTRLTLVLPRATADMAARVQARLFTDLVDDELTELRDQLSTAGLSTFFGPDPMGLSLQISGYDDKQRAVLETYLRAALDHRVDPERFAVVRDDLARSWRNLAKGRSNDLVAMATDDALEPDEWHHEDGADHLEQLTPEALQAWLDDLFDAVTVRAIVHGNHTADEAVAMGRLARDTIGAAPAPLPPVRVRRVPAGRTVLRDVDVEHADSAIRVLYRPDGHTFEDQARWLLLANLLGAPAFTELRTEQQLGYIVWAGYGRWDHLPGLTVNIQSSVAEPQVLLERIDAFLASYADTLAQMPVDEFETVKAGLIANLEEAPANLYQRTNDLFRDFDLGVTTFDRKAQLVAHLRPLQRAEIEALLRDEVVRGGAGRLVVRAVGRAHEGAVLDPAGCPDLACVADILKDVYVRRR